MLNFILNLDLLDKPSHIFRYFEKSRNREAETNRAEIISSSHILDRKIREVPLHSNSAIINDNLTI